MFGLRSGDEWREGESLGAVCRRAGGPGDADSGPQFLLSDGRCYLTSLDLISFSVTIVPA